MGIGGREGEGGGLREVEGGGFWVRDAECRVKGGDEEKWVRSGGEGLGVVMR